MSSPFGTRHHPVLASTLLLAAVGLWATPAAAVSRIECRAAQSQVLGRAVRYCVLLPPSYDAEPSRRYPALYYLHGLGEDEQTMLNLGGWSLAESLLREGRIGEFLIVVPAGGASFYVNSRDGRVRYEDFFIREFIPRIDRSYRTRAARAHRGLTGFSMGGYGALRLAFKYPHLFVSVSAHSAALMESLPRGISAATAEPRVRILGQVFGSPMDQAYYDRNSPFTLARESKALGSLKIYFDCGQDDHYGFQRGAQALHELLESRRIAHAFKLYPGGHDFLYLAEHLDASLEFHSGAFGLGSGK
jgi:S-formylglutathione hydrolase FrmB